VFQRVHIEISNICNVQCSFCPVVERPKDIMSVEKFKALLEQVTPMTKDVCLHLMGEPLAHPDFRTFLEAADELGTNLQITTNGLLIKRYREELLDSRSVRQINFSLQAFKDNFPDRPIGEFLDPIIDFTETAFLKKPDLYLNYRLWNHGSLSFSENEEVIEYLERHLGFKLKRDVDVGGIKSKRVFPEKRLYFHFDSRFEWPSPNFPIHGTQGTCHGLGNHFGIHADGTVVPCCLDKEANINLGNAFERPVSDILNGDRAKKIAEGFKNGILVEDLCKRCTYIKRFNK
jgi:radical SAM protein with 4Fe4S-binding SPASM domain